MLRRKRGAEAYENSTTRGICAVASAEFEAIFKRSYPPNGVAE